MRPISHNPTRSLLALTLVTLGALGATTTTRGNLAITAAGSATICALAAVFVSRTSKPRAVIWMTTLTSLCLVRLIWII